MVQASGFVRPSSTRPSQSLSIPSQISWDGFPGGGALQKVLPSTEQAITPEDVQAPRPTVHALPTPSPSSILPLQLSSRPLHRSGAFRWISESASLQSALGPVAQ